MTKFYSRTFHLPPLSAKIYAYLTFDFKKEGVTFDDLVDNLGASKSSISTNLNLLLANRIVVDVNKMDDRKRYFMINKDFVKIRFTEIANRLEEELQILKSLDQYREEQNYSKEVSNQIYQDLLRKNIDNIKETLTQL